MDIESIFSTIFTFPEASSTTLNHIHVRCQDSKHQIEFIKKLSDQIHNKEHDFILGDGNCLLIDKSPKDLFYVIAQAFDSAKSSSSFRTAADFLKHFHEIKLNKDPLSTSQFILCLRRAEYLHDIEGYPIIADLFRGFGDPVFKKHVKLITLSTIPWCLMLSYAPSLSPTCIFVNYSENKRKTMTRVPGKLHNDDLHFANISDLSPESRQTKEESLNSVPYFAKFILVSAFCCSFNRRTTDLRFFDREREGRKRGKAITSDSNKFHETGPQTFTITRLLGVVAFFFNNFLNPNDVIPDVNYLINRLCEMRFLTRISNTSNISTPKFRCDAPSDFVRDIATSLDIDIALFLDGNVHDLVSKLQLFKIN